MYVCTAVHRAKCIHTNTHGTTRETGARESVHIWLEGCYLITSLLCTAAQPKLPAIAQLLPELPCACVYALCAVYPIHLNMYLVCTRS